MARVLDYTPALNANLNVDDTGNTFAGVLQGKYKVYIDPYAANVAAQQGSNPGLLNPEGSQTATQYTVGQGMRTDEAENLGSGDGDHFNQMAFSIEKVTVTAKSRALKAEYSLELAQDLKAIHGLNAEAELANILSTEILAEINREVILSLIHISRCRRLLTCSSRWSQSH